MSENTATQQQQQRPEDTEQAAPPEKPGAVATPPRTPGTGLVEAAAADAAGDLARADSTNATLAGMAGVLLTILAAGAGLTGSYAAPVAAAAVILAAVLVVLAAAMWPHRSINGTASGIPHYARHSPADLAQALAEADPDRWHAERAVTKARIARRKHFCQRLAGAGLALAGILLATAVATGLT